MEEYLRDKAKSKSIAIYTFNTINGNGTTSIKTQMLKDALK